MVNFQYIITIMGGREVSRPYQVWFFAEGERFLCFCFSPPVFIHRTVNPTQNNAELRGNVVKKCTFPRSSASFLLRSLACGAFFGGGGKLEWSLFGSGGGLWVASLWTAAEEFEGIGIHLGHVALNGVAVFPLACTEFALNVEFGAFAHIFLHDFGLFAPNHDIVPLCALG